MKRAIPENPPQIREHHVRLPQQLAQILRADSVHARGLTGHGIKIAVIDSGFFHHPYYLARGCRIRFIETARERAPHIDEYGHGTAQLASVFSLAPDAEVLAIKCMDRDPSSALEHALGLRPHIISCAWGFNIDHPESTGKPRDLPRGFRRMYALIREAVASGIIVVAAGGNGQRAFPGSMPEVIAAGGAYYAPDGQFYPSDISSQFASTFFPGREVPDLCGIVGNLPHGRLLLVPVPPKARLARRPGFATIAAGGASAVGAAGWAMFSGTSAATSMISGACALLLEHAPHLTPFEIKSLLCRGARILSDGTRVLDVAAALEAIGSASQLGY